MLATKRTLPVAPVWLEEAVSAWVQIVRWVAPIVERQVGGAGGGAEAGYLMEPSCGDEQHLPSSHLANQCRSSALQQQEQQVRRICVVEHAQIWSKELRMHAMRHEAHMITSLNDHTQHARRRPADYVSKHGWLLKKREEFGSQGRGGTPCEAVPQGAIYPLY